MCRHLARLCGVEEGEWRDDVEGREGIVVHTTAWLMMDPLHLDTKIASLDNLNLA